MSKMHLNGETQGTACGQWMCNAVTSTSKPELVTCKRCLAAAAKAKRTGRPTK